VLPPSLRRLGSAHPKQPGSRTVALFRYTFLTRSWPVWARYLTTAAIVLSALALRLALDPFLEGSPFLLFVVAIILCAALFDHGSGIFAVLLSAALAKWFLIEPTGTLKVQDTADVVGLAFFIGIGLLTAAVLEALHRVAADLIEANERLIASEQEKDLLMQEASHRFKNELAMLTALLRLQERAIEDTTARAAFRSTADRVHVLGRVHERLLRANHAAVIDTREFLAALCDDLRSALVGLRPISLKADVESHFLPQERAVPVGLVLNELLTNALKYAFPDGRNGTVRVRFTRDDEGFCLIVSDDGVGKAPESDGIRDGGGLGQRLVASMVAQLEGSYELTPNSDGTGSVAQVRFPAQA
jgi:two-component system, sensor histidine kinase PdtaS